MSSTLPTPDTGLMRQIVANHARFYHLFERSHASLTDKELDFAIYLPDTIAMLQSIGLRGIDFLTVKADEFQAILENYPPGGEDVFAEEFVKCLTQNSEF